MTIQQIILIVATVVVALVAIIVAAAVWVKSLKKVAEAKEQLSAATTEAEKVAAQSALDKAEAESEAAKNDLLNKVFSIVPNVDSMFASATNLLTEDGKAAKPYSGMKKAVAEAQLKTYADSQGYTDIYDPEEGSQMIEQVVAIMNTERNLQTAKTTATTSESAAITTATK